MSWSILRCGKVLKVVIPILIISGTYSLTHWWRRVTTVPCAPTVAYQASVSVNPKSRWYYISFEGERVLYQYNGTIGTAFEGIVPVISKGESNMEHSKKMQGSEGKETNIDKTNRREKMETVRDRLWLWGHPAGSHNHQYGLVKESHITPADAAAYMDIRNVLVVRYGPNPKSPFVEWAKPLATLDRVMWSVEGGGGGDVDEALGLMNVLPNLRGLLMDDYFGRVPRRSPKKMWLAQNNVRFPVTMILTFPQLVAPDKMELVQSDWGTRDYLSKDIAVDLSENGTDWEEVATGTLPPAGGASVMINLPKTPAKALRIRVLSTHDKAGAFSCGLTRIRLWSGEQELISEDVRAQAGSEYPGHPAENVLTDDMESGTFTLEALQRLRERLNSFEQPLELWVVLYTNEFDMEYLRPHLDLCDAVMMWTWQASNIVHLEENFAQIEDIAVNNRKILGLYMYDYGAGKPMPVDLMEMQCEMGLRWLKEGRIEGMIFLASCICDLNLDAVEWTRSWIAKMGDQKI